MTAASDSKTAEFARLLDLFERLASRKSRSLNGTSHTVTTEDIRSIPVPTDLVSVVHSLAPLVGTRKHLVDIRMKKDGGRSRKKSQISPDSEDEDEVSLAKFPLGKKYPFTFKMMLHRLYQLDDWAEKVKKVLERSQLEYKSLAEKSKEETEAEVGTEKSDNRVHFKTGPTSSGPRRPSGRPRSHSVLVISQGRDVRTGPISPGRESKYKTHEEARAIKKRCVGRRKSMGGPISTEGGKIGAAWVYDAAGSSFEPTRRQDPETFSTPIHQARLRYQSLEGDVRKDEGRNHAVSEQNGGGRTGKIATRRRTLTLSIMETPKHEEGQRRQMKRPYGL